jgi:hypothetical protein
MKVIKKFVAIESDTGCRITDAGLELKLETEIYNKA